MSRVALAVVVSVALVVCWSRPTLAGCTVQEIGARVFGERIRDVEIADDYAYLAAGYQGLAILDVADPSLPTIVGVLPLAGYAQDVEVAGDLAYVATTDFGAPGGLSIVDVFDRSAPTLLAQIGSSFSRVEVAGPLAYAIDPEAGLEVIDVSVPTNPSALASLDLAGSESDIAVDGSDLYLAVGGNGEDSSIRVVDASAPTAPVEVAAVDLGARVPVAIEVEDGTAFVSAAGEGSRGLVVLDVSDLQNPVELAFVTQPNARSVKRLGQRAYFGFGTDAVFGGGLGGLRIFEVSDVSTPVPIGSADTTIDESAALAVSQDGAFEVVYAAVSGAQAGLRIFEVDGCPDVHSVDVIPESPDNPILLAFDTEIEVLIPGAADFDVTGVDPDSLRIGDLAAGVLSGGALDPVIADRTGDGNDDLTVYFQQSAIGIDADTRQLCLSGLDLGHAFVACDWITPNQPPQSRPGVNLNGAVAPVSVQLFASDSFDPEGSTLQYDWTFSDGSPPDSGEIISRDYATHGDHEVTLTVTDDYGQTDAQTIFFTIFLDSDADGIADSIEIGPDPENPVDSDGDGLPDYLDPDSDNDGLLDGDEDKNHNGRLDPPKYGQTETDRLNVDTDFDGYSDFVEVTMGSDPVDESSTPAIAAAPALGDAALFALASLLASIGLRLSRGDAES